MGYKLNILSRIDHPTGWHQSTQFEISQIQQIKVDGGGANKSLNSVPSPFARMHLFETAFQLAFHDLTNGTRLAGDTYNKLISDCFDVFELLYHWESHKSENKPLEIITWKKEEELRLLAGSRGKNHGLLGTTFQTFLDTDPAFEDFKKCIIIRYDGKVIAGSSPFTGFFTTPDDLGNFRLLKPLSQVTYFSRTILFEDRKPDVKKYIYDFFEKNEPLRQSEATRAIRDYLDHFNASISDRPQSLVPLTSGGVETNLFGRALMTAKPVGNQFFEPYLIRLNYRINEKCFCLPRISNANREFDYLLPLTAAFFEQFNAKDVADIITLKEQEQGTVEVIITLGDKVIRKLYQDRKLYDQDGKIIDLYNQHNIQFSLSIFPFLRVTNQPEGPGGFNDFYRVASMIDDRTFSVTNKDFALRFGKNHQLLDNGDIIQITRNERTLLSQNSHGGSTFYGLNSDFDFIQVEFPGLEGGSSIRATIVPTWKEKEVGTKQIDYAIDFGTTSTFIAMTDDPDHQNEPRPFEFDEKDSPVALLNKQRERKVGTSSLTEWSEIFTVFPWAIEAQKVEFVPSLFRRGEKYQFPIRTVIFQQKSVAAGQKNILINANVGFAYQKKGNATIDYADQEYKPNLKWNLNMAGDYKGSVKAFLEELFVFIRVKTLLSDCDPRISKVYWFYPLSFSSALKKSYTDLWEECSRKILKSGTQNVLRLTESEAPYHFLFKQNAVSRPETVLTMDIGGGSTDIMLIAGNKPVFGTSVYFGANVIWGNGYGYLSGKDNGIFQAIQQEITQEIQQTDKKDVDHLKELNAFYCSDKNKQVGSDEIINFWISIDQEIGETVHDHLSNGKFKLSYLLHLSALIYHSLKLLKINQIKPPSCVIFSGNGSKYIDLIHDPHAIERIWGYFAGKIFGPETRAPEVVMPKTDRKEATCYGGLAMSGKPVEIATQNFLGFENPGEKTGKTYGYLTENKDELFSRLLVSFGEFIDWFFAMNQVPNLSFRNEFGIEKSPEPIKKFLLEKAEENLQQGYLKRTELVSKEDLISDSLFFYPLVGLIYKINKLTEQDLYELTDKTTLYSPGPDNEMDFSGARVTSDKRPDSIYTLTCENNQPDVVLISVLNEPDAQKHAIAFYQNFLSLVCEFDRAPALGQSIRVITPGKAQKQGNRWQVIEKVKIEFY